MSLEQQACAPSELPSSATIFLKEVHLPVPLIQKHTVRPALINTRLAWKFYTMDFFKGLQQQYCHNCSAKLNCYIIWEMSLWNNWDYYSAPLKILLIYTDESHRKKWTWKFGSSCFEFIRRCWSYVISFLCHTNHWQENRENIVLKAKNNTPSETHLISRVLVSQLAVFALAASPVAKTKWDQQHKTDHKTNGCNLSMSSLTSVTHWHPSHAGVCLYWRELNVVSVLAWGLIWIFKSKNS